MSFVRVVRLVCFVGVVCLVGVVVLGCRSEHAAPAGSTAAGGSDEGGDWLVDRTKESHLDFVHFNGMSGQYYYPEILAPGVALFDYDNDGDLDIFITQGQMLGTRPIGQALFPPPDGTSEPRGRLFRNDLTAHADGSRTLTFTDITAASGIDAREYGMGVATGDFNNDGCVDLYITSVGRNQLYRNNCNGTFTDVSKQSGTDDRGWSVSAAFVDFDRDGWLDLFVGHYVNYSIETNVSCFSLAGRPDYCPPHVYTAQPSRLYRNKRDGTFVDVTATAGLATDFGPALGVATADFNGDGWIDIYAANDGQPNQLWINQRNGTFRNTALLAGAALGAQGEAKSSMGIDAGDFDNDGDEDLFITELTGQGVDLYVNNGSGAFEERSAQSGLRQATLPYTGFGTAWLDVDNDGWLDLMTVNGAVTEDLDAAARGETFALKQRKQLFRNVGNGQFEEVTRRAGAVFQLAEVGRGAAFGDVDNDGDTDVVVANASGPVRLLIDTIGNRKHWIGVRLVGGKPPRDMLGARLVVFRADGTSVWRRARADGSYASANDPRVLVGLGDSAAQPRVRVVWPDGTIEEWDAVALDRYTTLMQGSGGSGTDRATR